MANGGLLKKRPAERAENETGELGTWSVPKSGRCPKLNGKMSEFWGWESAGELGIASMTTTSHSK